MLADYSKNIDWLMGRSSFNKFLKFWPQEADHEQIKWFEKIEIK